METITFKKRCEDVIGYIFPNYENELNVKRYNNLIYSLKYLEKNDDDDDDVLIKKRCEDVIGYIFPNYKNELNVKRYRNLLNAMYYVATGVKNKF